MGPEEEVMRNVLATFLVLACPALVHAAIIVKTDLQLPLSGFYLPGQVVEFDAYAESTDPSQDEKLNAFTFLVEGRGFGAAGGRPRFEIPPIGPRGNIRYPQPSAAHPYVFGDYLLSEPDAYPEDPTNYLSDVDTVVVTASVPRDDQHADIGPARSGLARFRIVIPQDAVPGRYPIEFDRAYLAIGTAGDPIPVSGQDTFIVVFPEPAALGVLCVAALAALRRPAKRIRVGGRSVRGTSAFRRVTGAACPA
jgi:hypothetical protein